jgi:hypothetical protein
MIEDGRQVMKQSGCWITDLKKVRVEH